MWVLTFATVAAALFAPLCFGALVALEKRSYQTSAACLPDYSWMVNSKGVSPCLLAAVVEGACAGNGESGPTSASQGLLSGILDYFVPSLTESTHYNPATADLCSW